MEEMSHATISLHHIVVAKKLKERQMSLVGTIRKNRKELPPLIIDMKKKPLYHSEFVFEPTLGATLVSYVTKCKRFVTLLSTYHKKKHIDQGDNKKKPEIIKYYNKTKCGVDVMDEMVGTYRCKRKVNRWPVAVFCNMLDMSALNADISNIHVYMEYTQEKLPLATFLGGIGYCTYLTNCCPTGEDP